MYGHGEKQDPTIAEKCATDNNLDWDKISACYQGSLGHKLDLQMYNETASLTPAHQYTPWVTINGMVQVITLLSFTIDSNLCCLA